FYPPVRGKVNTQISSLFYRPSRTKRVISSTASYRRRDSLFYPPLKDEEIHLSTLLQEESQHPISSLFYRPSRTKRHISSIVFQRQRSPLFYSPARRKVSTKLKRYQPNLLNDKTP
ncbi:hypothetical protein V8G54_012898, partial [Vigna mungo]